MKRYIRVLLQIIVNLGCLSLGKVIRFYSRESKHVIILSEAINRRFSIEAFSWQVSTLVYLTESGHSFRLAASLRGLDKESIVYWAPNEYYGSGANYTVEVLKFAEEIEGSGCTLVPSVHEVRWLENKNYMYQEMKDKEIPMPDTLILSREDILNEVHNFPIIIKAQFSSGSRHVDKVESKSDLEKIINTEKYLLYDSFIVQEFLDIKKDLRVIYIDGEIASFYWRENLSSNWRPTATSKGNAVSFEFFPEQHKDAIIEGFERTELPMAAADIAWRNDCLDSSPVFLEISSRFSPNPFRSGQRILDYGSYKKRIIGPNPFWKSQVKLIHELNSKYLKSL